MLVWVCIVSLFSHWDGASHSSFIIDNLKTQADCDRIAAVIRKSDKSIYVDESPPVVMCVQVQKEK